MAKKKKGEKYACDRFIVMVLPETSGMPLVRIAEQTEVGGVQKEITTNSGIFEYRSKAQMAVVLGEFLINHSPKLKDWYDRHRK